MHWFGYQWRNWFRAISFTVRFGIPRGYWEQLVYIACYSDHAGVLRCRIVLFVFCLNLLLVFHRHCLAVYVSALWTVTFGPNLLFQISYKQPCQKDIQKPLISKPLSIFIDSDLFSKLLYILSALGRYCVHIWIDITFLYSGFKQRKKYHSNFTA